MAKKSAGFTGERRWYIPDVIGQEVLEADKQIDLLLLGIGFYPDAKFHFFSRNRSQALYYVLIYCYEGKGFYEIEGVKHQVSTGDVFVLPKGKAHCYYSDIEAPWTIYWLHFVGESASRYVSGLETPLQLRVSANSRSEYRIALFEEIFNSAQWCDTLSDLKYANSVLHHFLGTISSYLQFRRAKGLEDMQNTTDVAMRAIHYMRENIGRRIMLDELSEYLGYSTSRFSTLFRQKTGSAPLKYLTHMRIELACKYLRYSNYKVNNICFFVGFENPLYFTRVFANLKSMPPTAYRLSYSRQEDL